MASSSPACQNTEQSLLDLVSGYSAATEIDKKLGFLQQLCYQALPGLAVVDLEATFLSAVIPQAYNSIVGSLATITSLIAAQQTSAASSLVDIHRLLQAVIGCIECLEKCVVEVGKLSSQLMLSDIHSLSPALLKTITSSFAHCKDSESLYGDYFQQFSAELAGLFKKTYQLQKVLMELIDIKVHLHLDSDEQEIADMTEVCHGLLEICVLICDVDTGLLVNTWKVLNRLVTRHKEFLKNHIDVVKIVRHLCAVIEAKIMQCLSMGSTDLEASCSGDAKVLSRMLKVVRFLIGHLMHVVKEYEDFLDGCIADLLKLLVTLRSIVPSNMPASAIMPTILQEITSATNIVVEPLLKILITNKTFTSLATRNVTVEGSNFDRYGYCQVLVTIAELLTKATEEIYHNWMVVSNFPEDEPRLSLLQAIFHTFKTCTVEHGLPVYVDGVMFEGKPLRQISFYESVCTKMSALIATTPASCFHLIEQCLVECLLQDDVMVVLLAADLWAFLARWETADLCREHVVFLCKLLSNLPSDSTASANVSLVVRRLVPLMAEEHQESLQNEFPCSKSCNALIWSAMPLEQFSSSTRAKICRSVVPVCVQHLHSCLSCDDIAAAIRRNVQYLVCLRSVCSLHELQHLVPPVQHTAVLNIIIAIWTKCAHGVLKECETVLIPVMELTSQLLSYLGPTDYAQVLRTIKSLLSNSTSLCLRVKAAKLLGKCGTIEVTPEVETGVFSSITSLFSLLISDNHWFAHHRTLQAVKTFVEITPYTHIMCDCVPEQLLPVLNNFLCQVPFKQEDFPGRTIERDRELLARQRECLQNLDPSSGLFHKTDESRERAIEQSPTDEPDTMEPVAKRSKLDDTATVNDSSGGDDSYLKIIRDVQPHIAALLDLRSHHSPGQTVRQELISLRENLDTVIK